MLQRKTCLLQTSRVVSASLVQSFLQACILIVPLYLFRPLKVRLDASSQTGAEFQHVYLLSCRQIPATNEGIGKWPVHSVSQSPCRSN